MMKVQAPHILRLVLATVVVLSVRGATDSQDVSALQLLYQSLGSPQLSGWKSQGGDPCGESWLGVECTGSKVTSIKLAGQNLRGTMGYALDQLKSLVVLDLSNNQIGGDMSYQLPPALHELYLANNQLTSVQYSLKSLTSLTTVDVSHNQVKGTIPDVFQDLSKLQSLLLNDNQITGTLPSSLSYLTSLSTLHLQNNQLTGDVNILAGLPLQDLNIENNHFSGWVPASLKSIPNLRDGGNNFSSSPAPPPPPFTSPPRGRSPPRRSPPSEHGKSSGSSFWTGGKVAGFVIAMLLVAIVAGLVVFYFVRKKKSEAPDVEKQQRLGSSWFGAHAAQKAVKEQKSDPKLKLSPPDKVLKPPPLEKYKPPPAEGSPVKKKAPKISVAATTYSVADLQVATNSFSHENLLGEGSSGRVYRAELPNTTLVAVKKLDGSSAHSNEEFLATVSSLARLRHGNVVELVGYCAEHGQRLLVYEYFNKGTLHDMLHCADENSKRLSWNQRVKIALGASRALEYLHEVCSPPVVHRNFKSGNILLDDDLNPHLSDCGLATLNTAGSDSDRQVPAQIPGSFGYSAPEYAMSGIYTVKSDVYSFGVVMLELLTGRKPLDSSRSRAEQSLVRWATPQLHDIDALSKMVDPALKGIYPAKSLSRFADIISSCIQPEPEFRPPMSEVVQSLVRLMQRASLAKRSSGEDLGSSQRIVDTSMEIPLSQQY